MPNNHEHMAIARVVEPYLRDLLAKRPCVVLTGCRQTGKTFLAQTLLGRSRLVSLDLPRLAEEAETRGEAFLEARGTPLAIDEVQYAPALLPYVKRAIDRDRDAMGQYLLTGSQPFELMRGVTESLAGRAAIVRLLPLSLAEIEATAGDVLGGERLMKTLVRGAFPELYVRDIDPSEFFASYVATYLERDLRSVLAVRSLRDFDRFLRLLALRAANLLDIGNLASEAGVAVNTAKAWLATLENAGIVAIVTPWFENIGKRLVMTPKVYFVDTGLLCSLLGLDSSDALRRSQRVGSVFENLVYLEIAKSLAHRGRHRPIHFYRSHDGTEIDFVVAEAERLHLVEVKLDEDARTPKAFAVLTQAIGEERVASRSLVVPARGVADRHGVLVRGPIGAWPF